MRLIGASATVFALALILGVSNARPAPKVKSLDGQQIFRFDTFGDEQLWTKEFRLQEALETLTPEAALGVGLKVDVDALPAPIVAALIAGGVDLNDPGVTRTLLALDAVVGVVAKVVGNGKKIQSVGITCALCHSTVDNPLGIPGVGRRLDMRKSSLENTSGKASSVAGNAIGVAGDEERWALNKSTLPSLLFSALTVSMIG